MGLRGEKGTGFGLPLSKTFMTEYGGDMTVLSKVGIGSTFTLKFRLYNQEEFLKLSA
jgi:signal transduction histidine kinase